MLIRRLARPMLASIFIAGGIKSLRNPDVAAPMAAPVVDKTRALLPEPVASFIPRDPAAAVRLNGGVHVVGGLMLATGRFPRVSSFVLAASLVPTTLAGHPFWQEDDKAKRAQQQTQFFKNLSLMGGLIIAAVDTEGRPGVAWRSKKAAAAAGSAVAGALPSGSDSSDTVESLKSTVGHLAEAAKEHSAHLAEAAKEHAPELADAVKTQAASVAEIAKEHGPGIVEAVKTQGADLGRRAQKRAAKASKQASKQAAKAQKQARKQFA